MKDEEIKQALSEESDRLRSRKENVEKKVHGHNAEHEELAKKRDDTLKDGEGFAKM